MLKVNKKIIVNNETGQRLVTNILCKPTDENMIKLYKEYDIAKTKVNLDELSDCKKMSLTGEYTDIWTNLFVKPLAWLIIQIGTFLKSYGLGLILTTIFIRRKIID